MATISDLMKSLTDWHPDKMEIHDLIDHSKKSNGTTSRRLSDVLRSIADDQSIDDVSFIDLIDHLGGRGRAVLILLFAFPNIFPAPPGLSSILGLPLLYLSYQMMLGRLPWLPAFIGERRISRERFAQLIVKLIPFLTRTEDMLRTRHSYLAGHTAERPLGALCLVLAIILALPIPLGNMMPALSICLMSLGILERDGVWASIGALIGIASIFLVASVVYAMAKVAFFIFLYAFS